MSWCGSVCNWVDDNVVEPVEEAVDEASGWVEDNIIHPLEDAVEDTWDRVTDAGEGLWEDMDGFARRLEETVEGITRAIEEAWDEFKDSTGDFLSDLWDGMQRAWEGLLETLETWGQWLREQVDTAAEWLIASAEAVLEFVVDDLVPWVVALIKLPWIIGKVLGALVAFGICWLTSKFTGPEEVRVIEAITEHHPRMLEDFRIERLPLDGRKYVVFSDIHMYVEGYLDFYNDNRNSLIHRWLLANEYDPTEYHVIDCGDIEDFWMRGGSIKGNILDVADMLPYPYHYNAFVDQAALSANMAHAANIFSHNALTYDILNSRFLNRDRYSRVIGNHDDVWDSDLMLPLFGLVFERPLVANDYVLLDDPSTLATRCVLAHGHQSDAWNMKLCDYAGKIFTNAGSALHMLSLGALGNKIFYKKREDWEDALIGPEAPGFKNELSKMGVLELQNRVDEVRIYKELENIYGDSPEQPHLIFGHTHNVRDRAGVPDWMFREEWEWDEYSNSGTTGMWEDIVFCLEIEYPDIRAVAWYLDDNGAIQREDLTSYRYGDVYLR